MTSINLGCKITKFEGIEINWVILKVPKMTDLFLCNLALSTIQLIPIRVKLESR